MAAPSEFSVPQQQVIDAALDVRNRLVRVQACAGAGKTRTLVEIAQQLTAQDPTQTVFMTAFANTTVRKFKTDLGKKGTQVQESPFNVDGVKQSGIYASTMHKAGKLMYNIVVPQNNDAKLTVARDIIGVLPKRDRYPFQKNVETLAAGISFCMNRFGAQRDFDLAQPDAHATVQAFLESVRFKNDNEMQSVTTLFSSKISTAIARYWEKPSVDMYIFGPIRNQCKCPVDVLIVDEVQDLTRLECEFLQTLIGERTRVILVGDQYQTVYFFRGVVENSMNILPQLLNFNGLELLLPFCYRCPIEHLHLAQMLVSPDIIAWDPQNYKKGIIVLDAAESELQNVEIGDLVMVPSGVKAIQLAFECLKNKNLPIAISTYASTKKKMLDFCQRLQHDGVSSLDAALVKVDEVFADEAKEHRQSLKWSDAKKADTWAVEFRAFIAASRIADPAMGDVSTLEVKIRTVIFAVDAQNQDDDESDIDRERVRFSTVHCAKGLGHRNVVWCPNCAQPTNIDALTTSERNLFYVALTRSEHSLRVIGQLPFFPSS